MLSVAIIVLAIIFGICIFLKEKKAYSLKQSAKSKEIIPKTLPIKLSTDQVKELNFVAIDFETATPKRNSACSLAIIEVKGGKITTEHNFLIQPPLNEYSPQNSLIHNIYPTDTENAPTIKELNSQIFNLINGAHLVAHNASFDVSVLRESFEYYGLPFPQPKTVSCTYKISGKSLSECCEEYGIELSHHVALSDARACANLFVEFVARGIAVATIDKPKKKRISKKLSRQPSNIEIPNKNTFFYEKSVVITGVFENYEREEIADLVHSLGGFVKSSVSSKTDVLICGMNCGPAKLARVAEIKANLGKEILLIDESRLRKILR